jgi:hypothetical protein
MPGEERVTYVAAEFVVVRLKRDTDGIRDGVHVFVTATAEVDEDDIVLGEFRSKFREVGDGV